MQNQKTKTIQLLAGILPILVVVSLLVLPFAERESGLIPLLFQKMQFVLLPQLLIPVLMLAAGICVLRRCSVRSLLFAAAASAVTAVDFVVLLVRSDSVLDRLLGIRYTENTVYGSGFWLALIAADAALIVCLIALRFSSEKSAGSAADVRTAFTSADGKNSAHQIVCVSGEFANASFPLNPNDTVVIGRDSEVCNIVISAAKVSRRHCMVTYDAASGQFIVFDCSTNGTFLENGVRLLANLKNPLPAGTVISVGSSENRFKLE